MPKPVSNANVNETWTAGVSGDWSLASNWGDDQLPISHGSVAIETATALVVTFDVPALTLNDLTLVDDAINLQGGALAATDSTTFTNATVEGVKPFTTAGAATVQGLTLGGSVGWTNVGDVLVSNDAVTIGNSSTSAAQIKNLGTWTITDASGLTQASSSGWGFVNSGTIYKTSDTGLAWIRANFLSTGTINSTGGGNIVLDGRSSLSGTYIGAGMIDCGPDGTEIVGNVQVTQGACQTIFGTVDLTGVMTVYDGSTIDDYLGGHWNFYGDSSLLLAAGQGAGPDLHGLGEIAKVKGAGVSEISLDVDAQGVVDVATGTLSFEGATSAFSGAIVGNGVFEIDDGVATFNSGASVSVANWTLAGGATSLDENLSYGGAFTGEAGASLDLDDHALTLSGAANFSGLAIGGSGTLRDTGGATISGLSLGGTVAFSVFGEVVQSGGDVTLGDSGVSDAASLAIHAGGNWSITDGSSILLGADPASAITIYGSASAPALLSKSGVGVSHVFPSIVNSGKNVTSGGALGGLEATGGVLDIEGGVTGTGSDNIVGAATLEFDSSVAFGQIVNFAGASGVLELKDFKDFSGGWISGFDTTGSNDALLIGGGWSFVHASETATAATLGFHNASTGQSKNLVLLGDYEGGAFAPQSAGGFLKITY